MAKPKTVPVQQTWFGGVGNFNEAKDWSPKGSPTATDTLVIAAGRVRAVNLTITNPTIQLGAAGTKPTLVLNNATLAATNQIKVQATVFNSALPEVAARIRVVGAVTDSGAIDVGTTAVNVNQLFPADLTISIAKNSALTLSQTGVWFSNDGASIHVTGGAGATFADYGEIWAYGGSVTIDTPVTGQGYFDITHNNADSRTGTVEFKQAVSSDTLVVLTDGLLKLDSSLTFLGTIEDFNADSKIELVNRDATFLRFSDNVLEVYDGMHAIAALNILGNFTTSQFQFNDVHNNVVITMAPPTSQSDAIAAAAGLVTTHS